jgi:NAD(P)-dependent dehydrogenase (short-subunit alcohol dehydrogenase family)
MNRLAGKSAFISGAGGGIGRTAAALFAQQGCSVSICDRDVAAATDAAEQIRREGGKAIALEVDVTNEGSVQEAIRATIEQFGGIDVLYNNVGGSGLSDGPVTEAPLDEFWRCMRVDVLGTWLCCKYGIPALIQRRGGSVINMSSVLALMGTPGKDAYTAAKGAISALTRSMAVEYADKRIRVNAIAPGITKTPRVENLLLKDGVTGSLTKSYLFGLLEPKDVALMALYLASDESRVVTGQVFAVDSGVTIS